MTQVCHSRNCHLSGPFCLLFGTDIVRHSRHKLNIYDSFQCGQSEPTECPWGIHKWTEIPSILVADLSKLRVSQVVTQNDSMFFFWPNIGDVHMLITRPLVDPHALEQLFFMLIFIITWIWSRFDDMFRQGIIHLCPNQTKWLEFTFGLQFQTGVDYGIPCLKVLGYWLILHTYKYIKRDLSP